MLEAGEGRVALEHGLQQAQAGAAGGDAELRVERDHHQVRARVRLDLRMFWCASRPCHIFFALPHHLSHKGRCCSMTSRPPQRRALCSHRCYLRRQKRRRAYSWEAPQALPA